jgi:hypothetical protein
MLAHAALDTRWREHSRITDAARLALNRLGEPDTFNAVDAIAALGEATGASDMARIVANVAGINTVFAAPVSGKQRLALEARPPAISLEDAAAESLRDLEVATPEPEEGDGDLDVLTWTVDRAIRENRIGFEDDDNDFDADAAYEAQFTHEYEAEDTRV